MSHLQAILNQRYANAVDEGNHINRPSTKYKPVLSIDGNQWCALYGDNMQDGVAGFGVSPEKAFVDFDRAWQRCLPAGSKVEMCCRYCGEPMTNDPGDPGCPCSDETWGRCAIPLDEFEG